MGRAWHAWPAGRRDLAPPGDRRRCPVKSGRWAVDAGIQPPLDGAPRNHAGERPRQCQYRPTAETVKRATALRRDTGGICRMIVRRWARLPAVSATMPQGATGRR